MRKDAQLARLMEGEGRADVVEEDVDEDDVVEEDVVFVDVARLVFATTVVTIGAVAVVVVNISCYTQRCALQCSIKSIKRKDG